MSACYFPLERPGGAILSAAPEIAWFFLVDRAQVPWESYAEFTTVERARVAASETVRSRFERRAAVRLEHTENSGAFLRLGDTLSSTARRILFTLGGAVPSPWTAPIGRASQLWSSLAPGIGRYVRTMDLSSRFCQCWLARSLGREKHEVRPGAVRSADGAVPALGSQSVVVDVRIPSPMVYRNWSRQ
jgi:hypothetical protein